MRRLNNMELGVVITSGFASFAFSFSAISNAIGPTTPVESPAPKVVEQVPLLVQPEQLVQTNLGEFTLRCTDANQITIAPVAPGETIS